MATGAQSETISEIRSNLMGTGARVDQVLPRNRLVRCTNSDYSQKASRQLSRIAGLGKPNSLDRSTSNLYVTHNKPLTRCQRILNWIVNGPSCTYIEGSIFSTWMVLVGRSKLPMIFTFLPL